jgi:hypothetical protein
MKRFSTVELCGAVLGIVFLLFGTITIIRPQAGVVPHFTNDARGMSPGYQLEVVSAESSRAYGALSLLLGVGIIVISLYREKDD